MASTVASSTLADDVHLALGCRKGMKIANTLAATTDAVVAVIVGGVTVFGLGVVIVGDVGFDAVA